MKALRLERLQVLLNEQADVARRCVGQEFDVLFEKPGRYNGQLIGRSPYLQSVHVAAHAHKIGEIARVRVVQTMPHSLRAELVSHAACAAEAVA
jgi:tRNA-2-methylthio-N6-dimethylallyladenosine synthase